MLKEIFVVFVVAAWARSAGASLFGEENIPLMKLVAGQIVELDRLAETLQVAKDQRDLMMEANRDINNVISQIEIIDELVERSRGLDPKSIRSISQLNWQLSEMKDVAMEASRILQFKLSLVDESLNQAALTSETAYVTGQEMVSTGQSLAGESRTASPGRASQITASAQSAQMLAEGIQLQSLAHLIQIQAESLDLQKTILANQLGVSETQEQIFKQAIARRSSKGGGP
jgi:hypothetical protein